MYGHREVLSQAPPDLPYLPLALTTTSVQAQSGPLGPAKGLPRKLTSWRVPVMTHKVVM